MKHEIRIRNCGTVHLNVCPLSWDHLAETPQLGVRHCGNCGRDVFLCETDEQTIARAQAGDCIARAIPDGSDLPPMYLGQPEFAPEWTPAQEAVQAEILREGRVDQAIKTAQRASRCCPKCSFPAPNWRQTCYVCEFEIGRIPEPDEGNQGG